MCVCVRERERKRFGADDAVIVDLVFIGDFHFPRDTAVYGRVSGSERRSASKNFAKWRIAPRVTEARSQDARCAAVRTTRHVWSIGLSRFYWPDHQSLFPAGDGPGCQWANACVGTFSYTVSGPKRGVKRVSSVIKIVILRFAVPTIPTYWVCLCKWCILQERYANCVVSSEDTNNILPLRGAQRPTSSDVW